MCLTTPTLTTPPGFAWTSAYPVLSDIRPHSIVSLDAGGLSLVTLPPGLVSSIVLRDTLLTILLHFARLHAPLTLMRTLSPIDALLCVHPCIVISITMVTGPACRPALQVSMPTPTSRSVCRSATHQTACSPTAQPTSV